MMFFDIITLFPELFPGTLGVSIFKKSYQKLWDMKVHDLRNYGQGKHRKVDDEVFGGLPGMLIKPDVVENALEDVLAQNTDPVRKIFLSPKGRLLDQALVEEYVNDGRRKVILCGRYEGVDQRAIDYFDFEEVSIGNYILAGAEVAAQVLLEAIIRKIPGVIHNQESFSQETFVNDEISEPRYTRPAVWVTKQGDSIPCDPILLSGNHAKIKLFQKEGRKCITKGYIKK